MSVIIPKKILDISSEDKADLLSKLYDHADKEPENYEKRRCGINPSEHLTAEELKEIISGNEKLNFKFVYGRALNIDISGDTADFGPYFHVNKGPNAKSFLAGLGAPIEEKSTKLNAILENGPSKPGATHSNGIAR